MSINNSIESPFIWEIESQSKEADWTKHDILISFLSFSARLYEIHFFSRSTKL